MRAFDTDISYPSWLFHQGTNTRAWELCGAHLAEHEGASGVAFCVWAPNASAVSVVGDFNGWQAGQSPMEPVGEGGLWRAFVPGIGEGACYKYAVAGCDGVTRYKADPYAFRGEYMDGHASFVHDMDRPYPWGDAGWMKRRAQINPFRSPMNIYEVHMGSWRRHADGRVMSYRETADTLIPYVKSMGYTHIELLPITEHPFDGSWGYQVTGYFSVTSRYGMPQDFQYFVDTAHRAGLGVILDWVPAHFPKDEFGLYLFDGAPLYEDSNPYRMEHKAWGTRVFDFGRYEVRSFLISSAMFLMEKYHLDGLRVDAVASMLYLDYDRPDGEWSPNKDGGRENQEAIGFLQELNRRVLTTFPGALMVAEESTAWPMVTKPPEMGGLGFNFKWNMGWMNDSLSYLQTWFDHRPYHHNKLTFPLCYAFSENYILSISHDEVVHLKRSMLDKMPGTYEEKFAGLRAFAAYMTAEPGKKLMFMGEEIGQFTEWSESRELDWNLLDFESHRALQAYFRDLNFFYLEHPALFARDDGWEGFQWIAADDEQGGVLSLRRICDGEELVFVVNFSARTHEHYRIGVPKAASYSEILSSDAAEYGGANRLNGARIPCEAVALHGHETSLELTLPPLTAIFLKADAE